MSKAATLVGLSPGLGFLQGGAARISNVELYVDHRGPDVSNGLERRAGTGLGRIGSGISLLDEEELEEDVDLGLEVDASDDGLAFGFTSVGALDGDVTSLLGLAAEGFGTASGCNISG